MNDTNKLIWKTFTPLISLASSDIHEQLKGKVALVTVKRALSELYEQGYLAREGAGRSVRYRLTRRGLLLKPVDLTSYISFPQEERAAMQVFNHDVLALPFEAAIDGQNLTKLQQATVEYHARARDNESVQAKELDRLVVEMSWKSARIEGNTYTLLDTEKLLTYGIVSSKNTQFETQMLLNQKAAFDFIWETQEIWQRPSVAYIEKLHEYIVDGLGVAKNLRSTIVGITGTDYVPLGNGFQIREALQALLDYIGQAPNVYEKALMCTLGMSYIQPFADGNKRTARMTANALLLTHGLAPISYRSVDESRYKEATLVFYEQNSVVPFRELFVDQYIYSAMHYNIARP